MNFKLTRNQSEAQKLAREIAQNQLAPGVVERDETSMFPVDIYKQMAQLGLIGLPYGKEYGGHGGDYLSYILAVEEISRVDGSVGIAYSVSTSLYAGSIINSDATEEQKKRFLEPVLTGKSFGSFGLTEQSAGSDAAGQKTVAVKDGDNYLLNGSKCFITNGPLSDYFVVYSLTDPELGTKGMAAFVLEKGMAGFSIGRVENKMGIRSAEVSELFFDNVLIPAENVIAAPGKGFALAMKTLDGGRIGVGAQALGLAKGAFEIARKYLMERQQFGKPLYKQQYLAFKMAELATGIAQAELLLYKAAVCKQDGEPYSIPAAMAKMACSDIAMEVTTQAVQMLGGNGFMKEYHVERMMRDSKITQIYEGTNEIQRLIISGNLFR